MKRGDSGAARPRRAAGPAQRRAGALSLVLLLCGWLAAASSAPFGPKPPGEMAAPGSADGEVGPQAGGAELTIGRLQYGGGGDWYANPSSLPNLLDAIRERTTLRVGEREATVTPTDPSLRDFPYLYMTGHGNVRFTPPEREALREYLLAGGFLHVDDNYGLDDSFRREVALLLPGSELVEISPDHAVFHALYDLPLGLPKIHEHDGKPPRAYGIFHRGRLLIFYSHESDLGDGWEDPEVHEDPPELREQAIRMGVNLFLFALSQGAP